MDDTKLRGQKYKQKWADACKHQLSSDTHKYILGIARLLWKMEAMPLPEAKTFAALKWRRMHILFRRSVSSVELKELEQLHFLQITIRKIYGECSHKYSIFRCQVIGSNTQDEIG